MNKSIRLTILTILIIWADRSQALAGPSIVPDSSLKTNVNQVSTNSYNVTGGTTIGSNLFQSFNKFNLNNQESVLFENPISIKNILIRVTGNDLSNLNGSLRTNGLANLFILNPKGLIFGQNFKLNIGGSFFASTANALQINNSLTFDTSLSNLTSSNLNLDISNVKLIFNNSPGQILVNGNGLQLTPLEALGATATPTGNAGKSQTGFNVSQGNSIGLFANGVSFEKGVVLAPSGSVFVFSLSSGQVELDTANGQWTTAISPDSIFNDINLQDLSLIDTSGYSNGTIKLFGKDITLLNGSFLLSQSVYGTGAGEIDINAIGNLLLEGASDGPPISYPYPQISNYSVVESETLYGIGSSINATAENISFINGGALGTDVLVDGTGGDVNISSKTLNVSGYSKYAPLSNTSSILATNLNSGQTGNIKVNVNVLNLGDGGSISNTGLNKAGSGNIDINATSSINVSGFNPFSNIASQITTSTVGSGQAGDPTVVTPTLAISNGGSIGSRIIGDGTTGIVTVNTKDLVINGNNNSTNFTGIISAAISPDPLLAAALNLSPTPQGSVKSLNVTSDKIMLNNNAIISVQNDGQGNGGKLSVSAKSLSLLNNSSILASTGGGNGGNTNISSNILLIKDSIINSSAKLFGNGGNTSIIAQAIAGDYQSIIEANAQQGFGGNIDISTQALIFPLLNITASSDKGLAYNGNVAIKSTSFTPIVPKYNKPTFLGNLNPEVCNSSYNDRNFLVTVADIPEQVDDLKEIDSPVAEAPYFIDNTTGKKIIDVEMQGVVGNKDGTGIPVAYNKLAFGGMYLANACREFSKQHDLQN